MSARPIELNPAEALELRLDGASEHTRFGLGGRAVWLDGEFRTEDWDGWRAIRALRLFEASKSGDTQLAIAAGGLAPAQLGHVADGYRATLDDRPRTGIRGSAITKAVSLGLEIDDVVEPHLIGGAFEVALGEQWIGCASAAIDVGDPGDERAIGAVEVCGARRWARCSTCRRSRPICTARCPTRAGTSTRWGRSCTRC